MIARLNLSCKLSAYIVFGMLLFSGCDESLDPFLENDQFYFSMYGYLDASADLQWIRIINLQEEIDRTGGGINAEVSLKNLGTGERVILQDSLFQYSDNIFAYNFFTEYNIEPSSQYLLKVERNDGSVSSVIIHTPDTFPDPVFEEGALPSDPDGLRIRGVDNLADAKIRFNIRYPESNITQAIAVTLLSDTIRSAGGDYFIPVAPNSIQNAMRDFEDVDILDCEFYVARAGEGWFDFASLDRNLIALPAALSNVEKGTGYVVGVVSKTAPYPHDLCKEPEE